MSVRTVVLLMCLCVPAAARADIVVPIERCPPGLDRDNTGHGDVCVPRDCRDSSGCGSDARCVSSCECWRFANSSRATTRMTMIRVGQCDAAGRCSDGNPTEVRQCEPVDATPAFDPANHSWTGQEHPSSSFCSASSRAGVFNIFAILFAWRLARVS